MVLLLAALTAMAAAPAQEVAQAVYAKVAPSVLLIVVEDAKGQPISLGSGFVIEGNLVVTNAHVVRGGTAYVQTGVAKVPCTIIRIDERFDLAVLRAAVPLTAPALRAAPKDTPIGIRVYALGNPQGLERTITEGLYTGPRRMPDGTTLLQISAPISHGSSGGPIVDSNGLVVGIAVSSLESGQNLNFAVPVATLIELLAQPEPAPRPAAAAPRAQPGPPAPAGRSAAPSSTASAIAQFHVILQERRAMDMRPESMPRWRELHDRERELLLVALNAARHDDDLQDVHSAATNGHADVALDAARLGLKRAAAPKAWHYYGIASSALELAPYNDEPAKTELLQEAKTAVLKGLPLKGSSKGWLLAGQVHDALREWQAAKAAFNLALSVGAEASDRPAILRGLWRSSGGVNLPADADRWWAEFAKTGAATDLDYYERANYIGSNKRWAESAAIFEMLGRKPGQQSGVTTYSLWYSATYARWMAGEADATLAAAVETVTAAGNIPEAQRIVAMAYTMGASVLIGQGQFDRAATVANAGIAADPTFSSIYSQLARVYNATGRFNEAAVQARKAVDLGQGKDGEAAATLGNAYFNLKNWSAAWQAFELWAGIEPANAYPAISAALSYQNAGRAADAIRWYEEALRRDPNVKERDDIRASIAKLKGGKG